MKEPYVKPQIYRIKLDPVQTKIVEGGCCAVANYAKGGQGGTCGSWSTCGSGEFGLSNTASS